MTVSTLSVAMSASDRTLQLLNGAHSIEGYALEIAKVSVEDMFVNQISQAVYDVSELSLASYLIALSRGETRLCAIPVFLSRSFRHNAIYVRADSPWTHPAELKGKRFGFPEYQMTAAVWIRGMFRDEWGVATEDIDWYTFRPERVAVDIPATQLDGSIFDALVEGRVDAVMSARRPPDVYFPASGEPGALRRLIPNVWEVEREYYARTGIFPIMHLVSLKAATVEAHPELPRKLYDTMQAIKTASLTELRETIKLSSSDPFAVESAERSTRVLGKDLWPYGVGTAWSQIERFMDYLLADGLMTRRVSIEEVFHASVLDT